MGFFDKLKGELVDIIEWLDDTNGQTLVWRFPRYQNEIKNGAKLTVRPGQSAVFVDQGRIADVFTEGMYERTTANVPILATLKGWPVTMTFVDMAWGAVLTAISATAGYYAASLLK